ncbi:uncharacterized protein CIMG_09420 [Coccidioides immitis RS]|uniref:Uncharacterized protein n=3 Tax=Coccidioides immitis TaxID=5501 RepID=J3K2B4_COCIM|nr:uncharacterized protein CIMG_09420 [Coccidioides immitis RS]EAS28216.3 hypothetical protein CIMG_09420 [Coccidioides immitis RS]KMP09046.1 hypothetical protein CIRG_08727 [Coccidioides immitis RMSCC 2394]KMU77968.1 hypothetical protein CISG_06878 [Coccidioides immitis RMSCC 3703]
MSKIDLFGYINNIFCKRAGVLSRFSNELQHRMNLLQVVISGLTSNCNEFSSISLRKTLIRWPFVLPVQPVRCPSAQISEVQIPVSILVRRKANHIPFGASYGDPWPVKRRIALKTISQRLPLITHTISTQGDLGANASGLFSNTDPGNDLIKHA